jgi:hypothetical protein
MAIYPKVLKPWRGFPNMNGVHAISVHVKQDNPQPGSGQVALKQDIARHIGTLPKGAQILAVNRANPAAVTGTIVVGTQATPANLVASADVVATGAASVPLGALANAPLADDTALFILSTAAAPATGEINLVIQFYIHKD